MDNLKKNQEIKREDLNNLADEMYMIQALLETTSIALFAIQDEKNPVSKAVTMSFVIKQAAKMCAQSIEIVRELEKILPKSRIEA